MMNFTESFIAAKKCGTPLIAVRTPDPSATINGLMAALTADKDNIPPLVQWDAVNGAQWLNTEGFQVCWKVFLGKSRNEVLPSDSESSTYTFADCRNELALNAGDLVDTLRRSNGVPANTVIFVHNAHLAIRYDKDGRVVQAMWNLRDQFKQNFRVLTLIGTIAWTLPPELANDSLMLREALPTLEELAVIVKEQYDAVGAKPPTDEQVTKAVDAVCGLPAFTSEQAVAQSFVRRKGVLSLDLENLWELKRTLIQNTKGLSVPRCKEKFADSAGMESLKGFMRDYFAGPEPPRALIFLDEIEKSFAGTKGSGGDSGGGVKMEMLGTLLTEMELRKYHGIMLLGPAGTGKTFFAETLAAEFNIPMVNFDLNGMQNKFVGESNENITNCLATVYAISQGRALFIATANRIAGLPTALKRRFRTGTYFTDLPADEVQKRTWPIYFKKWNLDATQELPPHQGWTGAEIRNVCELSYLMRKPIKEVAKRIVPVCRMDAAEIEELRLEAARSEYLSTEVPGPYIYKRDQEPAMVPTAVPGLTKRKINVG